MRKKKSVEHGPVDASQWKAGFILICVAIITGGASTVATKSILIATIGLLLCITPPLRSPGKLIGISCGGFIILTILSFFPGIDSIRPEWWLEAVNRHEVDLPASITPQPWITFEGLFTLIAGVSWFYLVCDWRCNREFRRKIIKMYLALVLIGAGFVICGLTNEWKNPYAEIAPAFSIFPNRNHTALFFAIGSVLSLGLAFSSLKNDKKLAALYLACNLFLLFALLYLGSKSGILLYGVGCSILACAFVRNLKLIFGIGLPLLAIAASLLLSSSLPAAKRIKEFFFSTEEVAYHHDNFRVVIYQDTADMILDNSIFGVGLGNFRNVFPAYQNLAVTDANILHPESDVLMVAAESGVFGLLLLLLGYVGVIWKIGLPHSVLRQATAVTVFIAILHSFFDVPGHRFGLFLAVIYLMGLSIKVGVSNMRINAWMWRIVGVMLMLFGGYHTLGVNMEEAWYSDEIAVKAKAKISTGDTYENETEILKWCDLWISNNPLMWEPYFYRAYAALKFNWDVKTAKKDFDRARHLNAFSYKMVFYEGNIWMKYSQDHAANAYEIVLERAGDRKLNVFAEMMWKSANYPKVRSLLGECSERYEELKYQYLAHVPNEELVGLLIKELNKPNFDEIFNKQEADALIRKGIKVDSGGEFFNYLLSDEFRITDSWRYIAYAYSSKKELRTACDLILENWGVKAERPTRDRVGIEMLSYRYKQSGKDILAGINYLNALIVDESWEKALNVSNEIISTGRAPDRIYYWNSKILYDEAKFQECWNVLWGFINK